MRSARTRLRGDPREGECSLNSMSTAIALKFGKIVACMLAISTAHKMQMNSIMIMGVNNLIQVYALQQTGNLLRTCNLCACISYPNSFTKAAKQMFKQDLLGCCFNTHAQVVPHPLH